jgi:hypothetical protein
MQKVCVCMCVCMCVWCTDIVRSEVLKSHPANKKALASSNIYFYGPN